MRPWLAPSVLLCLALSSYATEPALGLVDHPTIKLVVDGKPSDVFDQAALAAMPRTTVSAAAKDEQPSTWQGVALEEFVRRTCVAANDALSGRALTRYVRVTGADGYQVVFSAAEIAADFGNIEVIVADARDGKPLSQDGPFRLIVPKDKRADRWVNHVTRIDVLDGSTP